MKKTLPGNNYILYIYRTTVNIWLSFSIVSIKVYFYWGVQCAHGFSHYTPSQGWVSLTGAVLGTIDFSNPSTYPWPALCCY